ncbi:Hypothetical predicted protein [Cloeon dipterum]|uniref:Uncharacterized protein n=1 Tax=Cloeon dipterum TaxID=197152 RepID=A0A8S1E988_9INSE|nr:Hypothetical predicted protein [Cloeon dipterum]
MVSTLIILACYLMMTMVGASKKNFSTAERNSWINVEEYMKKTFDFFYKTDHQEFLLILGDVDGESSELSLFLMGARKQPQPAKRRTNQRPHPFFAVDNQTNVLIVDMPNFGDFYDVHIDIMMAFTYKLIFEKAEALHILLMRIWRTLQVQSLSLVH